MKINFFLSLFLFAPILVLASEWKENSFLVTRESAMQIYIDQAVKDLYQSPAKDTLCHVFTNPTSLFHAMGVVAETAMELNQSCPSETRSNTISKVMQKAYYFSAQKNDQIESWTDFGNRTYIFSSDNFDYTDLKKIMTHELAIAFDAKANMLFTTYLRYQGNINQSILVADFSKPGTEQDLLRRAFNSATWKPISTTFSFMRAFAFEKFVAGQSLRMTHQECSQAFRQYFQITQKFEDYNETRNADIVVNDLSSLFSNSNAPKSQNEMREVLSHILDSKLTLTDKGEKVSFCQYMAKPLLTGRTTYNMFGNGPRPRLTGGSGSQGISTNDDQLRYILDVRQNDVVRKIQDDQMKNKIFQQNLQDFLQLSKDRLKQGSLAPSKD